MHVTFAVNILVLQTAALMRSFGSVEGELAGAYAKSARRLKALQTTNMRQTIGRRKND